MRIQIVSQFYEPEIGAAQVRLAAMTRELIKAGHQVDVVAPMPNYPLGRIFDRYRGRLWMSESIGGATVRRTWISASLGAGVRRFSSFATFAALAPAPMWRSPRPDIVLVESPPLFAVLPAMLHRLVRRVPYGILLADLWPDAAVDLGFVRPGGRVHRILLRLEARAYRRARLIAPVTEAQVATLQADKAVPGDKIVFMPNGVDVELFGPGPADEAIAAELAPHGERVLLYAGNHGYAHGLDVLLDAAPAIVERHPDARIVTVGSGSERDRLAARIRDEQIPGIVMLEPRPLPDIAEMYRVAVAGLSTLRPTPVFDGARPSKIFPAMASARPVVYSGQGEGARLIEDAGAGIVVAPEDPQALAAACIQILDDPEAAAAMGRRGRELAVAEFSWTTLIGRFVRSLEALR